MPMDRLHPLRPPYDNPGCVHRRNRNRWMASLESGRLGRVGEEFCINVFG
jgi:hypothetical protein